VSDAEANPFKARAARATDGVLRGLGASALRPAKDVTQQRREGRDGASSRPPHPPVGSQTAGGWNPIGGRGGGGLVIRS
jgi:hypothetical protein